MNFAIIIHEEVYSMLYYSPRFQGKAP